MMNEGKMNTVKCPKCGRENLSIAKICVKCKSKLVEIKSCPKCAKINSLENDKCLSCGYNFNKKGKKKHLLLDLAISLVFMLVMFALYYFKVLNDENTLKIAVKVVGILIIYYFYISTLFYGRKEKVSLSNEEEVIKQKFGGNRDFFEVIIATILFIVCILLFYFGYDYIKTKFF